MWLLKHVKSSPRSWAASKLQFHRWSNSTVKLEGFLRWKASWSNVGVSSQAKTYDLRVRTVTFVVVQCFVAERLLFCFGRSLHPSSVIDFGSCLLWGMCRDPKAVSMQVTTCMNKWQDLIICSICLALGTHFSLSSWIWFQRCLAGCEWLQGNSIDHLKHRPNYVRNSNYLDCLSTSS